MSAWSNDPESSKSYTGNGSSLQNLLHCYSQLQETAVSENISFTEPGRPIILVDSSLPILPQKCIGLILFIVVIVIIVVVIIVVIQIQWNMTRIHLSPILLNIIFLIEINVPK